MTVPSEIVLARFKRFFSAGGVAEGYERRGDELIEFDSIVHLLPGDATEHFKLSVALGGFRWRLYGERRAVENLVDLDSANSFAPGQYPLRPSPFTAKMKPLSMRARRSVWVHWIRAQGWPVPPGLVNSILIEHEPAPPDSPAPRLHDPETQHLVHDAAEKILKSGAVPKRRGSKKLLAEKLQQEFPKYRVDTLGRYAADAHAAWRKTK